MNVEELDFMLLLLFILEKIWLVILKELYLVGIKYLI